MAWPQAGSTYNITSVKHPDYNLNLLGGYGIKDGTNVTLWSKSTTDTDQQWRLDSNNKLYPKLSSTVCLDRYIANDSYYNNADLWTHDDDNQQILMFSETSKGFKIMLRNATVNGATLYLTAPSIPTGGNDPSKVPGANGNVYWSTSISDEDRQLWTFTKLGGSSGGDTGNGQKLFLPYWNTTLNASYLNADYRKIYPWEHYGVDFVGTDQYGNTQEAVYAAGVGTVVGYLENQKYLGNILAVQYDNVINHSGQNIGSVILRYCHLASIKKKSGTVDSNTLIAMRGATGIGAGSGKRPHLHLEADTDCDYPLATPSEPATGGTATTVINPMNILFKDSNQSFYANTDPYLHTDGNYYYLVDEGITVPFA